MIFFIQNIGCIVGQNGSKIKPLETVLKDGRGGYRLGSDKTSELDRLKIDFETISIDDIALPNKPTT